MGWFDKAKEVAEKIEEATAIPIPDFAKTWFDPAIDDNGENPLYPDKINIITGNKFSSDDEFYKTDQTS